MKIYDSNNLFIMFKYISIFIIFCVARNSYCDEIPYTMDSRVKTYIYNPNEVFPLVLHYGYHSHIDLPKNEAVQSIVLGNPADWEITNNGNKIFLQTYSKCSHTNMTLITSKRTYEFDLVARGDDIENKGNAKCKLPDGDADYDLAYAVRFYYPEDAELIDVKGSENDKGSSIEISDIVKGQVNSNYIYSGSQEIAPIVMFNDEKFTYLKFKNKRFIPKIEILDNKKEQVRIFTYNNYIIINGIFPQIKLSSKGMHVVVINKELAK